MIKRRLYVVACSNGHDFINSVHSLLLIIKCSLSSFNFCFAIWKIGSYLCVHYLFSPSGELSFFVCFFFFIILRKIVFYISQLRDWRIINVVLNFWATITLSIVYNTYLCCYNIIEILLLSNIKEKRHIVNRTIFMEGDGFSKILPTWCVSIIPGLLTGTFFASLYIFYLRCR